MQSLPAERAGRSSPWGRRGGPVFTPPRFPWVTGSVFFCSTSFHPSLSQAGGCRLPTQPGLPAGSSAQASSHCPAPPHRRQHDVGAVGSPSLLCGLVLGTEPPGPSRPGLWPSSVPSVSSWGGAWVWGRLVSEDQQHHVASPHWVMGPSQLFGESRGKCRLFVGLIRLISIRQADPVMETGDSLSNVQERCYQKTTEELL